MLDSKILVLFLSPGVSNIRNVEEQELFVPCNAIVLVINFAKVEEDATAPKARMEFVTQLWSG